MRKKLLLLITMCFLLSTFGCGKSNSDEPAKEETNDETNDEITIDDQFETFLDMDYLWKISDDEFEGKYAYAITDIDNDGNLEILVSNRTENSLDTTNIFYEFAGIGKIEKLDTSNFGGNDSEPDLLEDYFWAGCDDSSDERIHYLCRDFQNYQITGEKTIYYDVAIDNNNTFSSNMIGYYIYNDDKQEFYDSNGDRISLNDFNFNLRLPLNYKHFRNISWFYEINLENMINSYQEMGDNVLFSAEDDLMIESKSKLNEVIYDISITVDDSTLDYSDIDDESKELYKAFMTGDVNATVMNTCPDTTNSEWFKDNFVKGNSYNIQQIIDKCAEAENMECTNEIEGKYLDCGLDGNYELLVGIRFDYGSTSYLDLIIKNLNGKLYLCFVGDSWERKWTSYGENGFCGCLWNVDGSRHAGEEYYIDAEGKCNFYEFQGFDCIDELEEEYQDSVLKEVNLDFIEFCFARFSEEESDTTYAYAIDIKIDDEFIERTDETEDLFVAAEKIIEDKGYKILSPEDEEAFFKEMRYKIGFTEDIYNADISYYEH